MSTNGVDHPLVFDEERDTNRGLDTAPDVQDRACSKGKGYALLVCWVTLVPGEESSGGKGCTPGVKRANCRFVLYRRFPPH